MPVALQQFAKDAFRLVSKTMDVSQFWKGSEEGHRGPESPGIRHVLLAISQLIRTLKSCTASVTHALLDQFHMRYSISTSF